MDMMDGAFAYTQSNRLLKLICAPGSGIEDDVLLPYELSGEEGVSEGFTYRLLCLSANLHLPLEQLIGLPVQVAILTAEGERRAICGFVTQAERLDADGAFALYRLTLQDPFAVLQKNKRSRVFQDLTVLEFVRQILEEHLRGNAVMAQSVDLRIECRGQHPKQSWATQLNEQDAGFIQRWLAQEGIAWYIEHGEAGQPGEHPKMTIVLFDDVATLTADPVKVRFHRNDGVDTRTEDVLTDWNSARTLQPGSTMRSSYDYKAVVVNTQQDESRVDQGDFGNRLAATLEDYEYEPHFSANDANDYARYGKLRMAAHEFKTELYNGSGTHRRLPVGSTLKLSDHPSPDDGQQFTVTQASLYARNNLSARLESQAQTLLQHPAATAGREAWGLSSDTSLTDPVCQTRFTAARKGVQMVPAYSDTEYAKPVAPPMMTAIVVGPPGEEIHVNKRGCVQVKLKFTRTQDHSHAAGAGAAGKDGDSIWIRVMQPWTGSGYGHLWTPRVGDECVILYENGDIDRPIIVGSLFNGTHPPPDFSHAGDLPGNKTQSGIKSKMYKGSGCNEIVWDDTTAEQRLRVATDHSSTALNLGYLVHPRVGGKGQPRGEGLEARTDGYAAFRAGKGMLISTDARDNAKGTHLDSKELTTQLKGSLELSKTLSDAAKDHNADPLEVNDEAKRLVQVAEKTYTQSGGTGQQAEVAGYEEPILALSSPAGILGTTPKSWQIAAGENVHLSSQKDLNFAVGNRYSVAVKQSWSVFVATEGMKLFAGKGKVQIQAQDDNLEATAKKDVKIASISGNVEISTPNSLTLTAGGCQIKLSGGGIDIKAPGTVNIHGATKNLTGPAGGNYSGALPQAPMKKGDMVLEHLYENAAPIKGANYKAILADGVVKQGVLDGAGKAVLAGVAAGGAQVLYNVDPNPFKGMQDWLHVKEAGIESKLDDMFNGLNEPLPEYELLAGDGPLVPKNKNGLSGKSPIELPLAVPPGVSINENIKQAEVANFHNKNSFWFYDQVRNKGPWDYKQKGNQYADFGNFNFGATGAAFGFSEDTLLRMAGWAQKQAGTSMPEWGETPGKLEAYFGIGGKPPFGDDPKDQHWVKQGIRYYQENKGKIK